MVSETIVEAFGSVPLAVSACSAHRAAGLDGLLHMVGAASTMRLSTVSLVPTTLNPSNLDPWINTGHQGLIVGFLLATELDEEQPPLVPLWAGLALLQQEASFARMAGHQRHASAIDDGDTHPACPFVSARWRGRFEARTAKLFVMTQCSWSMPG